ncbi:MAG: (2Fe-2S)-binding protein [Oscillospiraceae bacterium]|nr:(2Fe-2S)-binding protein [Oscillospiraceae bacterium]
MTREMTFRINGEERTVVADPSMRLLDLIRDVFMLKGTKEGCSEGECGACTVIMDGEAVTSCIILAGQAEGRDIITIEGVSKDGELTRLQQAFVDYGAVQCGYCTPGMILSAKALLDRNPHPTDEEIKTAISGNLCRCTGYKKIFEAIKAASEEEA